MSSFSFLFFLVEILDGKLIPAGGSTDQLEGSHGNALGMVSSRGTDDSFLHLLLRHLRHAIEGPSDLEGVHRLQVQPLGLLQGRFNLERNQKKNA